MPRTIAIIAPLIDTSQYNMDYTLRLARNNQELTLATMYRWAYDEFKTDDLPRGTDYSEDIPSAGFYLQGLLNSKGYRTILTNRYDAATLSSLAQKDLFAVCVSTTMIINTDSLLRLLAAIRKAMPGVPVIAGGVNIWKNYFQFGKHLAAPEDYPLNTEMLFHPDHCRMDADVLVIAQHGISALLRVLLELEKGSRLDFSGIPNLCLPGIKGFVFTEICEEEVDYNEDFTRWDLIEEMPEKVPLRTSIGCPYRCRFCDFCHLFPRIFLRSKGSLSQELGLVRERAGTKPVFIHVSDDNVFINKKRLNEVCSAIAGSGYYWAGFMRGGVYGDEEMKTIVDSGLKLSMIGVESGDQEQLDRMNKKQKIERVKKGIEQFDAYGISVLMTFVVGFPGETRQTLRNTIDFLNNLSLTQLSVSYQMYPLMISNLSEIAEPPTRRKWKIEGVMDKWSHYSMNSEEALAACYEMFKAVEKVPYTYSEESHFFNRGMFDFDTRLKLFQLRHQLTVMLIENAPWEQIGPVLKRMAILMEMPVDGIGEHLRKEILLPDSGLK